jgi:hypothetical protein
MIKSDKRAREKPCLRCGYSLRRIDALHCPECGLSVWRSLNANDALEWSNPPWLMKLVHACRVLALVQVVGLAAFALSNVVFFLELLGPANPLLNYWIVGMRFLPFLTAGYEVGLAFGLFLLAAEEGRYPDKWRPFKWGCRIVGGLCAFVALWTFLGAGVGLARPQWAIVSIFLSYSLNFAIIAGVLAAFAYLRKLAQRIPHGRVAKFCGWMLLAPALGLLKAVPFFAVFIAIDLFGWLLAALPLLYLPASVVLLLWFAKEFRKASIAAEKGWASETAGTQPAMA